MIKNIIIPILKSLLVPVIRWALIGAIYSRIAPFFALNCIFFPANEEATLKTKQPIRFQGLFKVTDQIAGKWKTKSIVWQILLLLFPKFLFSPQKMDEFKWPSPVFGRFQNGCNKVVIEPRVVQSKSKFEITRMISAQIALYSVQLPLLTKLAKPLKFIQIMMVSEITSAALRENNWEPALISFPILWLEGHISLTAL